MVLTTRSLLKILPNNRCPCPPLSWVNRIQELKETRTNFKIKPIQFREDIRQKKEIHLTKHINPIKDINPIRDTNPIRDINPIKHIYPIKNFNQIKGISLMLVLKDTQTNNLTLLINLDNNLTHQDINRSKNTLSHKDNIMNKGMSRAAKSDKVMIPIQSDKKTRI